MKKLLKCFLIIQLAVLLTGCGCPCGKKPAEQSQPVQNEQTEQK